MLLVHDEEHKEKDIKRLFRSVAPTKRLSFHTLPKDYFIEDRENVTVERINDRMLLVHDEEHKEKERVKELFRRSSKKLALLRNSDRRRPVKNYFELPYTAVALMQMQYRITPEYSLRFSGTGFRNSFNQIVTAGHNVFTENDEIETACKRKRLALTDYSYRKENLSINVFFGFRETDKGDFSYIYSIPGISGIHSFKHGFRDFAVVSLPVSKSTLDKEVGALGISTPSQPHEYFGKEISIVGYPGEKKPKEMYFHTGKIKGVSSSGTVTYDVDTTKGNSGSPGFLSLIKKRKNSKFPVCLVHTHSVNPGKLNGGEIIDTDLIQFMQNAQ